MILPLNWYRQRECLIKRRGTNQFHLYKAEQDFETLKSGLGEYTKKRVYPYESPLKNKKYTPDFYITQGEHAAWLEHYALTESGYSNVFTPRQLAMYKKAIRDTVT